MFNYMDNKDTAKRKKVNKSLKRKDRLFIFAILFILLILLFQIIGNSEKLQLAKDEIEEKNNEVFLKQKQEKEKSFLMENSEDWMLMLVNAKKILCQMTIHLN